jgi:hypothetical protein
MRKPSSAVYGNQSSIAHSAAGTASYWLRSAGRSFDFADQANDFGCRDIFRPITLPGHNFALCPGFDGLVSPKSLFLNVMVQIVLDQIAHCVALPVYNLRFGRLLDLRRRLASFHPLADFPRLSRASSSDMSGKLSIGTRRDGPALAPGSGTSRMNITKLTEPQSVTQAPRLLLLDLESKEVPSCLKLLRGSAVARRMFLVRSTLLKCRLGAYPSTPTLR